MSVLHEVDLALVEVLTGLEDVDPVPLPKNKEVRLPKLREKVYVLGFPVGGNDLSITEGVVSRIEVQSYSHSHARALAVTVDAAINSGNSGGPVLSQSTGGLVGVAFQGYAGSSVENQGHMVPAPVIDRFLKGVLEGDGPRREASRVEGAAAAPEPRRASAAPQLAEPSEVLEDAGRHAHGGDGDARRAREQRGGDATPGGRRARGGRGEARQRRERRLLGQRLAMVAILQARFIGDVVPLKILRGGEEKKVDVTLKALCAARAPGAVRRPPAVRHRRGLALPALSLEYLQSWGGDLKDAPTHLVEQYYDGISGPDKKEVVVLSQVLSDDVNVGFTFDSVGLDYVATVDGAPVADMESSWRRCGGASRARRSSSRSR